MTYEIGADESVREAIRRVGREQLDRAITELSEQINQDPVKAIHAARKAIKKERSLLRLARGSLAQKEIRRENAVLRKAARTLSAARDADVMIASVDELSQRFAGQVPHATFDVLRAHLEAERTAASADGPSSGLDMRALESLGTIRPSVDDWRLSKGGWKAVEGGLIRSYKRGQKALDGASASPQLETLHEWRKRVKDLWYQERLLAATCGPAIRGQAKELHHLADLLGDDHDLALLRDKLTGHPLPVAADLDAVVALIDHRRQELQREAFGIGRRVYAESPQAFRRRMRACWRAGRALARAPREEHPAELSAAVRRPGSP